MGGTYSFISWLSHSASTSEISNRTLIAATAHEQESSGSQNWWPFIHKPVNDPKPGFSTAQMCQAAEKSPAVGVSFAQLPAEPMPIVPTNCKPPTVDVSRPEGKIPFFSRTHTIGLRDLNILAPTGS
eukprot:gi/632975786/ref/XP_007904422.1/ PREDICTED: putative monooxygenase p33MONOX [Callorhinchus milii]